MPRRKVVRVSVSAKKARLSRNKKAAATVKKAIRGEQNADSLRLMKSSMRQDSINYNNSAKSLKALKKVKARAKTSVMKNLVSSSKLKKAKMLRKKK